MSMSVHVPTGWDGSGFSRGQQVKDLLLKFQFFKVLASLFFSKGSETGDMDCWGSAGNVQRAALPGAEKPSRVGPVPSASVCQAPSRSSPPQSDFPRSSSKPSLAASAAPRTGQATPSLPAAGHEHPHSPTDGGDPWGWKPREGRQRCPARVRRRALSVQQTQPLFLDLQTPTSRVSKSTAQKYILSLPCTHRVFGAARKGPVLARAERGDTQHLPRPTGHPRPSPAPPPAPSLPAAFHSG